MKDINLQKISSLISQKLNKEVEIVSIEKVGSGYHSDGFKLTAKNGHQFFLKRIKSNDLGFEIPEQKIMSLLISNGMYHRSGLQPQVIGLVLDNGEEEGIIPEVNEETAIYHIQEFQPEGISYQSLIQDKKQKTKVDEVDLVELEKITDYIVKIHKIKHSSKDVERLKSVYNNGLRTIITSPELTIMLLQDFPDNHKILPTKEHGNYVGLMLNVINKWKDRYDRLSALHGDFWGANVFLKKDGSLWVIDYSRIPWGDGAIDVGWWLSQYLWLYHETHNEYFKELGEKFLDMYIEKSGDKEIRQALSLIMGLTGIIYIYPKFFPNLDMKIGERFFTNILEILHSKEFIWKK